MAEAIVVGTDGSDTARRAVDEAIALAGALGAELHVVSAFEPLRGSRIAGAPKAAADIWAPTPDAHVETILAEASAAIRAKGVTSHAHASEKEPADAVLEIAEQVGARMIVVGNKGMHGAGRFVLGNVPNRISHRAPCSVLIVSTAPAGAARSG